MEPQAPSSPSYEELVAENARLRQQVGEVSQKLADALAEIERLKRSGKRQATPFSTGRRVAEPKKPGRKPGQGTFSRRQPPPPEHYTEEHAVPLHQKACPKCNEALRPAGVETVTLTELPRDLRLDVVAHHLGLGECVACGHRVRATHPEVPPDQTGATAHRVGDRLMCLAHQLHYGVGVPVRKVPVVLSLFFGKVITQGAITQDALRRAQGKLGEAYEDLRKRMAEEPAVNTDDTGWKVGGATAFLMGFFSRAISFFQIRARHRNEEVREVIPSDYKGIMGTDGGRSYDARELSGVKQQKCLSHIHRWLTEALDETRLGQKLVGRGRHFCLHLKKLLREATALWQAYQDGTAENFEAQRKRIQEAVTIHLRRRKIQGDVNRRLLSEVGRHHDAGNLLRFLTSQKSRTRWSPPTTVRSAG